VRALFGELSQQYVFEILQLWKLRCTVTNFKCLSTPWLWHEWARRSGRLIMSHSWWSERFMIAADSNIFKVKLVHWHKLVIWFNIKIKFWHKKSSDCFISSHNNLQGAIFILAIIRLSHIVCSWLFLMIFSQWLNCADSQFADIYLFISQYLHHFHVPFWLSYILVYFTSVPAKTEV